MPGKNHNKTAQLQNKETKTPNKTHITIKKKCSSIDKKRKDCELHENLL